MQRSRKSFIAEISVDRAVCIVGGLLGIVGTVLPAETIKTEPLAMSATVTLTFLSAGAPGFIVLLIAVVLGGGGLFRLSRAFSLAGLALSTLVLSKLFGDWFNVEYQYASMLAQDALARPHRYGINVATPIQYVQTGAGTYCLLLGFAVLLVAYARLAGAPPARAKS